MFNSYIICTLNSYSSSKIRITSTDTRVVYMPISTLFLVRVRQQKPYITCVEGRSGGMNRPSVYNMCGGLVNSSLPISDRSLRVGSYKWSLLLWSELYPSCIGTYLWIGCPPPNLKKKKFVCFDSFADRGSSSRVVLAAGWVPTDHGFQSLLSLQWAWMLNVLRLCWCRSGFEFFLAAMRSV